MIRYWLESTSSTSLTSSVSEAMLRSVLDERGILMRYVVLLSLLLSTAASASQRIPPQTLFRIKSQMIELTLQDVDKALADLLLTARVDEIRGVLLVQRAMIAVRHKEIRDLNSDMKRMQREAAQRRKKKPVPKPKVKKPAKPKKAKPAKKGKGKKVSTPKPKPAPKKSRLK